MPKPSPKIAIILLNSNGKKDTLECLASLQKVQYPNFQTIVVDRGSTDDSIIAFRAAYPAMPILETGGNNLGIEWALRHHAEWILLLKNNTIVAPDFLNAFLAAAHMQPKAKILGAKILHYNQRNIIERLGAFWNKHKGEFEPAESGEEDHPFHNMMQVDSVCAALFMHRSVPETIGLLEPKYFLFWEEADYCYRARRGGFEVWTAPEAKIWHKVPSSFTGENYFWWRGRLLWIERNCGEEEKKRLYRKVILPEVWKLLKAFVSSDKKKANCSKAGYAGMLDYFRGRFGNSPDWLK